MAKYDKPPFADYWAKLTPQKKHSLADRSGIPYKQLSHLANGHLRAGLTTMTRLSGADKKLTLAMMRPDMVGK